MGGGGAQPFDVPTPRMLGISDAATFRSSSVVPCYPLSFHTFAHSFAPAKISTLLFPIISALFAENHPGWGHLSGRSPRRLLHCPPMARQRLGQHFLADLHWREEIARAIRVSPHSTVPLPRDDQHCWIEIGSGHGEMTQHLLATGAPVHAIEIDPAFLPGLRHLAKQFPNLTVVAGDILEADLAAIASGRRIRAYGNLPYYITSPSSITCSPSPISSTKFISSFRPKSRIASPHNPARAITAIFPSSPSSTRGPSSSSKFPATPSIRRRRSPRPLSRFAFPANAQSSRSAPAHRQPRART